MTVTLHEPTPLATRLFDAARKFSVEFSGYLGSAALHSYMSVLDNTTFDLSTEPRWSFVQRFRKVTTQYFWLACLQERDNASRVNEPCARDLQYIPRSGHLIRQSTYPQIQGSMKEVLREKHRLGHSRSGIILVLRVKDCDSRTLTDFMFCIDIPDVCRLQYSYYSLTPDQDLELCVL